VWDFPAVRSNASPLRALLKRPKVLIFDEALSSLDGSTAEHFARTINSLKGQVTILFITHHLPRNLKFDAEHEIGGAQGDDKRFEVIRGGASVGPAEEGAKE